VLKPPPGLADRLSVIIRIALAAIVVGVVGVMTGTIQPSKVLDRVPRVLHSVVPDEKQAYLDMVDDNLSRLQPLSDGFFSSCNPNAPRAGTCAALSPTVLRALEVFRTDLDNAKVPDEFTTAHAALRRAVATGIQGFRLVERAVWTKKRRDWIRARNVLGDTALLLERALQQLPTLDARRPRP
jgi:hypothetical protein